MHEFRDLPLTPRESQIALLVSRGFSNKEIARALGIGDSTVKVHMQHIFLKYNVNSRWKLARKFIEERTEQNATPCSTCDFFRNSSRLEPEGVPGPGSTSLGELEITGASEPQHSLPRKE